MKLKQLFNDDGAVSPVIGVILMVAITVILAAVIASFVLGLGSSSEDVQPNTSFNFDYEQGSSADTLTITLGDGDSVESPNLYIRGNLGGDINANLDGSTGTLSGPSGVSSVSGVGGFSTGSVAELTAGQGVEFESGSAGAFSNYDVDMVWETSENTATLDGDTGPDA